MTKNLLYPTVPINNVIIGELADKEITFFEARWNFSVFQKNSFSERAENTHEEEKFAWQQLTERSR